MYVYICYNRYTVTYMYVYFIKSMTYDIVLAVTVYVTVFFGPLHGSSLPPPPTLIGARQRQYPYPPATCFFVRYWLEFKPRPN
jgi:hypothetical protein